MGYEIMVSGIKDLLRWYMKFVVQSHLETPLASPSFETNVTAFIAFKQFYNLNIEITIPLDNISGLKLCNSSGTLCGRVLGTLVSDGVGPICLGPKSVTLKKIKKKKEGDREKKNREKRREREKNTSTQILSTSRFCFICGPIKLKFGREV